MCPAALEVDSKKIRGQMHKRFIGTVVPDEPLARHCDLLLRVGRHGLLCDLHELVEGGRIVDGDLGKRLAIERHHRQLQTVDEFAVTQVAHAARGIDAHDPEPRAACATCVTANSSTVCNWRWWRSIASRFPRSPSTIRPPSTSSWRSQRRPWRPTRRSKSQWRARGSSGTTVPMNLLCIWPRIFFESTSSAAGHIANYLLSDPISARRTRVASLTTRHVGLASRL